MATKNQPIVTADRQALQQFIVDKEGVVRQKVLEQVDLMLIQECIALYGNNQSKVAEVLGLSRGTLRTRMINLNLLK